VPVFPLPHFQSPLLRLFFIIFCGKCCANLCNIAYMTSVCERIASVQRRPMISLHVSAEGSWRSDSSVLIDRARRIRTAFDRLLPALVGRSVDGRHPRRCTASLPAVASDAGEAGRRLGVTIMFFHLEHGAIHDISVRYHHTTSATSIKRRGRLAIS